jgi:hypothetical protein
MRIELIVDRLKSNGIKLNRYENEYVFADGFHKSDGVAAITQKDGIIILYYRGGKKEIQSLKDIVQESKNWYEKAKSQSTGYPEPSKEWGALYEKYLQENVDDTAIVLMERNVEVHRSESSFDRACDEAYQFAVRAFGIDQDGHTSIVPGWERSQCEIELTFTKYTRTNNSHTYQFRAKAIKNV